MQIQYIELHTYTLNLYRDILTGDICNYIDRQDYAAQPEEGEGEVGEKERERERCKMYM